MANDEVPCAFCGAPSDLLCDHILGFQVGGFSGCDSKMSAKVGRLDEHVPGKGLPYVAEDAEMFTCDAPLCDECARTCGTTFVCGRSDTDAPLGFHQSIDLCPLHHDDKGDRVRPITSQQAERLRMQWRLRIAE